MNLAKKTQAGLCFTVLLSGVVAGCSSQTATNASTQHDQVLNLTLNDEIPTMDLAKTTDNISFTVATQTMEGLVRLDDQGKASPGIAQSWDVSQEGLTYTFHLRTDAVWSDGTAVTAKDFEYAWKRLLNPSTAAPYAFMLSNWIQGAKEYNEKKGTAENVQITATDDKTLVVKLINPIPFFAAQMSFPVFFPLKQEFVEKQGDKYGSEADKFLSNGPFQLTDWKHEQSVALDKNPKYWDKAKVKLQKVNFQISKDSTAKENLYTTGQIDEFGLMREQVDRFSSSNEYKVVPDLTTGYLLFNENRKFLQNKNIRKALTYAVDAVQYADIIYHNGTKPATGFVSAGIANGQGGEYRQDAGALIDRSNHEAKAKEYLQQGLKELGLTAFPKIKLMMFEDDFNKKGAELITEKWRTTLGVDVDVENVPTKLFLQKANGRDYDIAFSMWMADYNDPMTYLDMWVSHGDFNRGDYSNPAYDQLIHQAQKEADPKKREQQLIDAEKILMEDMPIGPVYFRATAIAVKPYVKNFIPRVCGTDFDLKTTYIEGKK